MNLAGEHVYGKWTKEKNNAILQIRIQSTKLLSHLLSSIDNPPKVLVSASTVGYYGRDKVLKEDEQLNFLSRTRERFFGSGL